MKVLLFSRVKGCARVERPRGKKLLGRVVKRRDGVRLIITRKVSIHIEELAIIASMMRDIENGSVPW